MEVATNRIHTTLGRTRTDCRWEQIFNFHYQDGARMLTFGGVIVDGDTEDAFRKCHFDELLYYSRTDEPFQIRVPNLTGPEMHRLSRELPNLTKRGRQAIARLAISEADIGDYERLYRYLPTFVEAHA